MERIVSSTKHGSGSQALPFTSCVMLKNFLNSLHFEFASVKWAYNKMCHKELLQKFSGINYVNNFSRVWHKAMDIDRLSLTIRTFMDNNVSGDFIKSGKH